jgi:RNA 3'-terminal phosphate cyclase
MTQHTLTNINVIKRFIDVNIEVRPIDDKVWHIEIG